MREIKFKLYNKLTGNFYGASDIYELTDCRDEQSFGCHFDKQIYIFMQYTGLKDKNGKEIYEGDIAHIIEDGDWGGEYYAPISYLEKFGMFGIVLLDIKPINKSITNDRADTIWTRGFLTRTTGLCITIYEAIKFRKFEIIGNIYENKELLE
jgi:uncharacterized phage protein (TIGR01671 family)